MGAPETRKGEHLEATEIAGICGSWERLGLKNKNVSIYSFYINYLCPKDLRRVPRSSTSKWSY